LDPPFRRDPRDQIPAAQHSDGITRINRSDHQDDKTSRSCKRRESRDCKYLRPAGSIPQEMSGRPKSTGLARSLNSYNSPRRAYACGQQRSPLRSRTVGEVLSGRPIGLQQGARSQPSCISLATCNFIARRSDSARKCTQRAASCRTLRGEGCGAICTKQQPVLAMFGPVAARTVVCFWRPWRSIQTCFLKGPSGWRGLAN
jgi:hypothetical protein